MRKYACDICGLTFNDHGHFEEKQGFEFSIDGDYLNYLKGVQYYK